MQLSKHIFWDVDINSVDFQKHSQMVMERVVTYGNLEDWHKIKLFYGMTRIKKEVTRIRILDKKTLNILSLILKIPTHKFRCYKQIQSTGEHWSY